nr:Hypothetical protein CBG04784 [Haemonchus contortus]
MSIEDCSRNESYDFARYAVIVYIGTPIALAGVVCNCILLKIANALFAGSRNICRSSHGFAVHTVFHGRCACNLPSERISLPYVACLRDVGLWY